MRFAGNFHPEWGYLAPAPSFMRTARIVAVATAIGATAGAGVVLSLVERPAASPIADSAKIDTGKTLVVVHSLVQPAEVAVPQAVIVAAPSAVPAAATPEIAAAPAVIEPQATTPASLQASVPQSPINESPVAAPPPVSAEATVPAPSDSRTAATPASPASVAVLSEVAPATTEALPSQPANDAAIVSDQPPKPVAKKRRAAENGPFGQQIRDPRKKVAPANSGLPPLLKRIFSAGNGTSSN